MESRNTTVSPMVLTVPEAAKALQVCSKTVYELAASEGFPALRLGKRIVIPVDGLRRWIDEQSGGMVE